MKKERSCLVDGVIGAEDAELLSDAVIDEGVFEVHAVAPDQRHQLVKLDLCYDLKAEAILESVEQGW